MRAFTCGSCGQLLFFPNDTCLRCGADVGLRPSTGTLVLLGPDDARCANHQLLACNWLVEDGGAQCRSCRLTRTWPPLDDPEVVAAVTETEAAKRRLVLQLIQLGLPADRLAFDLLSSRFGAVTIGHADAVVTLDVEEADDARRVQLREQLDEPYRTLLGHLRHESGHGMFPVLVEEAGVTDRVRSVFGDETVDYQQALDRHYQQGPPTGWEQAHVSAYATMHPAEDWAETFAHLLHILDTLETAGSFGLAPVVPTSLLPTLRDDGVGDFADVVDAWLPLTYALNAVNRSLGKEDLYPFVLANPVIVKLALVHDLVRAYGVT